MELDEMIEVLQAFKDGKKIEVELTPVDGGVWTVANNPNWNFSNNKYRIKPQPTREEITAKWIDENKISVGSKVKIIGNSCSNLMPYYGVIAPIEEINKEFVSLRIEAWSVPYPVESLEPYKEEYVPFTHLDYELFMGKIIIDGGGKRQIILAFDDMDITTTRSNFGYARAFEVFKFIDGSVFGKLKQ